MSKIKGYLDQDVAANHLVEFLRANTTYTADMLLGVELFPFQSIMIKTMQVSDYTMCV
jgi:hypothetical protein